MPDLSINVWFNSRLHTYRVQIGTEMFDMSRDAHLPNGYCQYAGLVKNFWAAEYVATTDKIPIGIVRAIARIVAGRAHELV